MKKTVMIILALPRRALSLGSTQTSPFVRVTVVGVKVVVALAVVHVTVFTGVYSNLALRAVSDFKDGLRPVGRSL